MLKAKKVDKGRMKTRPSKRIGFVFVVIICVSCKTYFPITLQKYIDSETRRTYLFDSDSTYIEYWGQSMSHGEVRGRFYESRRNIKLDPDYETNAEKSDYKIISSSKDSDKYLIKVFNKDQLKYPIAVKEFLVITGNDTLHVSCNSSMEYIFKNFDKIVIISSNHFSGDFESFRLLKPTKMTPSHLQVFLGKKDDIYNGLKVIRRLKKGNLIPIGR